jgi:hypothetical protein
MVSGAIENLVLRKSSPECIEVFIAGEVNMSSLRDNENGLLLFPCSLVCGADG